MQQHILMKMNKPKFFVIILKNRLYKLIGQVMKINVSLT